MTYYASAKQLDPTDPWESQGQNPLVALVRPIAELACEESSVPSLVSQDKDTMDDDPDEEDADAEEEDDDDLEDSEWEEVDDEDDEEDLDDEDDEEEDDADEIE